MSACAEETDASANTRWEQGHCLKPSKEETYSLQKSSKEWETRCSECERRDLFGKGFLGGIFLNIYFSSYLNSIHESNNKMMLLFFSLHLYLTYK